MAPHCDLSVDRLKLAEVHGPLPSYNWAWSQARLHGTSGADMGPGIPGLCQGSPALWLTCRLCDLKTGFACPEETMAAFSRFALVPFCRGLCHENGWSLAGEQLRSVFRAGSPSSESRLAWS